MEPGEVITLTFGDMAENHVGMEQIGQRVSKGEGFQLSDLVQIQIVAEGMGIETVIHKLNYDDLPNAFVLVMRNALDKLTGQTGFSESLYVEQKALDWDKMAKIYGRVVNKHARWNLCYDETARQPDYANGKGCIVAFTEVPKLALLREKMAEHLGSKAQNLKVEGNYYYDVRKCGIGYHGDTERRKVIGVRLGNVGLPIYYQWYKDGNPIGERIEIDLSPGDIYIMDEKAVGTDWKQRKTPSLRHATGCAKYC